MDVKNLMTFLEVADTKSFSISASNLKITQPAVSKRVATLEEQLSTRLFDRVGKKILLTETAEMLLPSARKIVSEIDYIEDLICQPGNRITGKLSICTSPHIASGCLPDVLTTFASQHPEVEISVEVKNSTDVVEDIENGVYDIGICELAGLTTIDLQCTRLRSEKLNIVVAKHHSLASYPIVRPEDLASHASILPPETTASRVLLSRALAVTGHREKNAIVMPNFNALARMVETGLGWGILPASFPSAEAFVVLDVVDVNLELNTYLLCHSAITQSHAATAFVEKLGHPKNQTSLPAGQ